MKSTKEARARIKINKLLEEAGLTFFDDENGTANIQVEPNVKISKKEINFFGEDFKSTKDGFIDFLSIDKRDSLLSFWKRRKKKWPMLASNYLYY